MYFEDFSDFITNKPIVTLIMDISLTFNWLELINKVISFLNITTEARAQYKISSGILPISWIYVYSLNYGIIISPNKSVIFDWSSNINDKIEHANVTESTKTKVKDEGMSITNEVSSIDSEDEIKSNNEGNSNISLKSRTTNIINQENTSAIV